MDDKPLPDPNCPETMRVTDSVPMAHVADVDRSVRFYALLGFACESRFSSDSGVKNWAEVCSGQARLFLTRASEQVVPCQQAVLFYMYSNDVRGLREHLLSNGLTDVGNPLGEASIERSGSAAVNEVVFRIVPRFYMPEGELRLHDPDGYVLLVGQVG